MLLVIIIMLVTGALSAIAAARVKAAFSRGQRIPLSSGYTGRQVAEMIVRHKGLDCRVVETPGVLTDHYNPMNKTLALSPDVYHGRTAAAAGVAAHEVGHALQHATGSPSMWARSILAPLAGLGSSLGPWLVVIGGFLGAYQQAWAGVHGMAFYVAWLGIILFGLSTLFTLVTVPNEFNASHRAKVVLHDLGIIRPGEEDRTVSKVLNAAGLTYVAAAVTSILWLLYYAWPLISGMGRND